jgi:hypothetical protein
VFREGLKLQLDLEIESLRWEVAGGDIKEFSLELSNHGFDAEVAFWVQLDVVDDLLKPLFVEPHLITARLTLEGHDHLPTPAPKPFVVQGVVYEKRLFEMVEQGDKDLPVRFRKYRVRFGDHARILWRQHFPSALFADMEVKKVIASQGVEGIKLNLDWPAELDTVRRIICLPLGCEGNEASFYDWVLWWTSSHGGSFDYDAATGTYSITAAKPEAGLPAIVESLEIGRLEVAIPETPRHEVQVRNVSTASATTVKVTQDEKIAGITRDMLVRTPIAARATAVKTREETRLTHRDHELEVTFQRFPTVPFRPNDVVTFDKRMGAHPLTKEYRVYAVTVHGQAIHDEPETDRGQIHTAYKVEMRARLEPKAEPRIHFPPFRAPRYPLHAEGKVVSEVGEGSDKTYEFQTDKDTNLDEYHVRVPLWNKVIPAPYEPGQLPPHFYFPAFRDQRVMMAIGLYDAEIVRFIEGGEGTRLPDAAQANHILFGWRASSQTSVRHEYIDAKPVLTIERTNDVDRQGWVVAEGVMTMEVRELEADEAADEKLSVEPKVEATRAELMGATEEAVMNVEAQYQMTSAALTGQLGSSIGDVQSGMDDAESEISGKIDEARAEIEGALGELGAKEAEIRAAGDAMVADLEALKGL